MIAIATRLISTGSFLPEYTLTNEMLTHMVETSDEWIVKRTGINSRHIAKNQSTADIAAEAAKKALAKSDIAAEALDMIIVSTVTPDSFTPSAACKVQAKLGAHNAFAFDISAACSGFVYASDIIDGYFKAGKAKNALVVCAETLSRIIDYTDRTTCCLFGDGAAAAVYQWSEDSTGIIQTVMGADGARGDALVSQALAPENPFSPERVLSNRFLKMSGKEIFRFAAQTVPKAIDEVLKKSGFAIEQIDWIIPHQANIRIIDIICRRYGLPKNRVYVNLDRVGNTSSASIPLCIDEMNEKGLLKKGQNIIFIGFGGGLTYGAVLMSI